MSCQITCQVGGDLIIRDVINLLLIGIYSKFNFRVKL